MCTHYFFWHNHFADVVVCLNANGLFRGPDSEPINDIDRADFMKILGHGKVSCFEMDTNKRVSVQAEKIIALFMSPRQIAAPVTAHNFFEATKFQPHRLSSFTRRREIPCVCCPSHFSNSGGGFAVRSVKIQRLSCTQSSI